MATCVNRWWTVAAGAVGCSLGAGVLVIYTFGVFASAMASDFGLVAGCARQCADHFSALLRDR